MKQVALGMHNYLSSIGTFPAGYFSRSMARRLARRAIGPV